MLRKFAIGCAVTLGLALVGCGKGPALHPDTAMRPNQPMIIDPIEDLKPGTGSWFNISNLRAGDREFGILVHYLETPGNVNQTMAITDVSTGKYYLDEDGKPKISALDKGFEVKSDSLNWSGADQGAHIKGTLKTGEAFDLTMRRVGPALAYGGTGYYPLIDNAMPTWEYAFPTMETTGTVTVGKTTYQVTGNSWFDRQWFKPSGPTDGAALFTGKASWTWIATRLPNGDALAVWSTNGARQRTWATIMRPDGTLTIADAAPLKQGMSGIWKSPKSGVRWPSQWTIVVPGTKTNLVVKSTAGGQETFANFARLEAVVHISGSYEGQEVSSVGYTEMLNDPKL